jgi:hypothetical protein
MKDLILHDDRELRRIETAIAAIEQAAPRDSARTHCLLAALKAERNELLKIGCRSGAASRRRKVAGEQRLAS